MTKFENEMFNKLAEMKIAELQEIQGEYEERAQLLADALRGTVNGIYHMESFMMIKTDS